MPRSVRKSRSNVVQLQFKRVGGNLFAVVREGRKLDVRPVPKRKEPPLPGMGTVVPFPARAR